MKKRLYFFAEGIRNRHVFGFDLLLFFLIPSIALLLRVDTVALAGTYLLPIAIYTGISIVWKLLVFFPAGMYNRYWRYASVDELGTVIVANVASMILGLIVFVAILRPAGFIQPDFPRSIPVMDGLLTMIATGGFRFLLRMGLEYREATQHAPGQKKRTLIVGAGVAGTLILKELKMNPHIPLEPVGFLDDDARKLHVRIHGVPVIGSLNELPRVVKELNVQEVIIAMPTAPGKTIRNVVHLCKDANVPSKTIPGIFEMLSGAAKVTQLRDVQIEDLLRRGIVETDTEEVARMLKGSCVMVTGAGGSIGAELCRQIAAFSPAELILIGHGENSIFDITGELRRHSNGTLPATRFQSVIGDIRDKARMRQIFALYRPDVVFHAAAHKHVGLMETNISEAITNNVLGTQVLVELADQYDVDRFLMISSDKAVNPTCVMGVTKRIAELIVHEAAERTGRPFVSVRFGNVLGSSGSVIPIFRQQIAEGGPVLVTDAKATRYFMTIPEAVQLVLQAATMGEGGEVFVLDMGEPIKIVDLARDLIRLSGYEEGKDIDISFIGLRKGEKLSEELFFASERVERSQHDKILVCRNGFSSVLREGTTRIASTKLTFVNRHFQSLLEKLVQQAHTDSESSLEKAFKDLVPEYNPVRKPAVTMHEDHNAPHNKHTLIHEKGVQSQVAAR